MVCPTGWYLSSGGIKVSEKGYQISLERDELHNYLGGYLPKGAIIYLEGPYSSGKSVLCQRFTYGLLKNLHTVTYISTELTVREFIEQMYSLDFPIASPLLSGSLLYIPVYPLIYKLKPRTDFFKKLLTAHHLYQRDVLVIDTFSSLVENSLKAKEGAFKYLSFLKRLAALGKTIILTVDNDELANPLLLDPFKSASTVYLTLTSREIGGSITKVIKINRYCTAENPIEDTVGFKVSPGVGIIIEITAVG
ncbi:MAG: AAA family ATPase [Thermoplasmata archaeon]|nr:MAG: AAA family ATPase [Thermoplasmata archaeon]RLF76417.1 MAG: AAA family ATPase [Thermoplasmata archaeon]HDD59472.1 AAA family ATPase [Euryarchaeota archaeon]